MLSIEKIAGDFIRMLEQEFAVPPGTIEIDDNFYVKRNWSMQSSNPEVVMKEMSQKFTVPLPNDDEGSRLVTARQIAEYILKHRK